MTSKRKFSKNGYQHLYQISFNKSLIFCTIPDMILLFTLICVNARKYHIKITLICIMFNHFHIQSKISKKEDMENFMKTVTWTFARHFNIKYGRHGQLFHRPFGNAPKIKPQKIAGNMIYIANNPVGKQLVLSAFDYRWNFLKYSPEMDAETGRLYFTNESRHPYSEEFNQSKASKDLLYLVKKIKRLELKGKAISYDFFDSERFLRLEEKEQKQLIDLIIITYNVIDYEPILQKYGSVSKYCRVLKELEGNEYDLNDDWEAEDYRHYIKMLKIAKEEGYDLRKIRFFGIENQTSLQNGNNLTTKNGTYLGDFPRQIINSTKNEPLPREKPEAKGQKMPMPMARKLIQRFKIEVSATDLEIRKFLSIDDNAQ